MNNEYTNPLDYEEKVDKIKEDPIKRNKLLFALELLPVFLIGIGIYFRNTAQPNWEYFLIGGGASAAFIYIFFSWYMFKVKKYQKMEVLLSIFSGILFGVGIVGIVFRFLTWEGAERIIYGAFTGGIGLTSLCIVLLLIHLNDERGSAFYRNLLARLLVMSSILLTIYIS